MKHIKINMNEALYESKLLDFYFHGLRIGVLDIETTGLNPSCSRFILGGLYSFPKQELHQFFAENRSEEREALSGFLNELANLDMVITYNGRQFDLPFIEKRREDVLVGRTSAAPLPYNLDLYTVLNAHSPIRKFVPNLKQKTVENYMGLWQDRSDEISGAESVELYRAYEASGDPALEERILLHNSDDVMQLARLTRAVTKSDFHSAMFSMGFPIGPLTVRNISLHRDKLLISGTQGKESIDYRSFALGGYPVESCFCAADGTFSFTLPVIRKSGMSILDLEAAGVDDEDFTAYPSYGSGFLVIEDERGRNFMEINHFTKEFITAFLDAL